MKRLGVAVVILSLLVGGCTEASPGRPTLRSYEFEEAGVQITAGPGAVPDGAKASVTRTRTPSPVEVLGVAGLTTLAPAAEITLDGGSTQPSSPLTVALDVPRLRKTPKAGVIGVVLQGDGAAPEFIAGRYDEGTSTVVVEVPHLSWLWPVQLDVDKLVSDAMTYVLESTGISTAQPDCAGARSTVGGDTYSVSQPAQAWVCLAPAGSGLQAEVIANSPVPFRISSDPEPSSSTPITDLGDEGTAGAVIMRALGLANVNEGLIGPGIATRFTYHPAADATLAFRASPALLLVQILIAALQPILDSRRIETLGKAKCFHDLVSTAQRARLDASTAASLTAVLFSCVGEIIELDPVGAILLALVSAAPQAFSGAIIGLIGELSGRATFQVQIAREQATASASLISPAEIVGFLSPSGNIACSISPWGVRCDVFEHAWQAPPPETPCPAAYGHTVVLDRGSDAAVFGCVGDENLSPSRAELPLPSWFDATSDGWIEVAGENYFYLGYGRTLKSGELECTMSQTGVRCANGSGAEFVVSRSEVEVR